MALAGPNGCGKSTLCLLLNGLILPRSGKVSACGMDTLLPGNIPEIRRRVGLIMQNADNQIVGPTVEDDVAFGLENISISRSEMLSRVEEALAATGLTAQRGREPHLLSAGEKKRLALAGALAAGPDVLVSDESTSMLDPPARADIMALFDRLRREGGISIVHATHRPEEMLAADRVVFLAGGRLVFDGEPGEFFGEAGAEVRGGLRPPALWRLARALRERGFDVPPCPLEAEEVLARL